MEQLSNLTRYLPPQISSLLAPDARQELLAGINECVLLFESALYRLANGQSVNLNDPADAEELGRAASQLLSDATDGIEDSSVLLLLPGEDFISLAVELPGISADNLASALRLQTESLLPACDQPLVMAVNAKSADSFERHVAFWMRQEQLDELFAAFANNGVFLAAVRPRLLAIKESEGAQRIIEHSAVSETSIVSHKGIVTQSLQLTHADSEQQEFLDQWQQELNGHPAASQRELRSAADILEHLDHNAGSAYSFYPQGALAARKKVQQGKTIRAGMISAAAVLFIAALPFLWQSFQLGAAERALRSSQELSADARADQTVVVDFENEWGAVSDFPQQNIPELMFALQAALAPDQLTGLDVNEGQISIEGNSADPQAILQKLEQDPLFTEVVFARATNNNRYFIDLRLSPVNFEGYFLRYFPDD